MLCEFCKKKINEPHNLVVTITVEKNDKNYVKGFVYTPEERDDLTTELVVHKKCWKKMLKHLRRDNKKLGDKYVK